MMPPESRDGWRIFAKVEAFGGAVVGGCALRRTQLWTVSNPYCTAAVDEPTGMDDRVYNS